MSFGQADFENECILWSLLMFVVVAGKMKYYLPISGGYVACAKERAGKGKSGASKREDGLWPLSQFVALDVNRLA